jgi:small subunit ribosomal protein S2
MREITLEELLEAGCHFGHQVTRSTPKARDFIFEARDNIHIIDLAKTKEGLEEAGEFVKEIASKNGTLVIVGTKRQAQNIVKESLQKVKEQKAEGGLFHVDNRWVGGLMTNFQEVSKNFKKYHNIVADLGNEDVKEKYTKKEITGWEKEKTKLESLYGGVANMTQKPDGLFVIDSHLEDLAVREAIATGVPTAAIVDTNADPGVIDHPIPANDDAVGSIKVIVDYVMDAWIEGRKEHEKSAKNEEVAKNTKEEEIAKDAKAKIKKPKGKKSAKKAESES